MRKDVERVRAVMTQQWEDMRAIRVMNQKYCSDIKTLQRSNDVLHSQNTQIRGDLKDVKQGIAMLSKQLTEKRRVATVVRAEQLPDIKKETAGWELGWQSDEKAIGKPKATSSVRSRANMHGRNKHN